MKFEDIKVGDKVLIPFRVRSGGIFSNLVTFYIERVVTRITKTQFCIGDRRFKKDSGSEVGDKYTYAFFDGDTIYHKGKDPIHDQTAEYRSFIKKRDLVREAEDELRNTISFEDWSEEDLYCLITAIKKGKGE